MPDRIPAGSYGDQMPTIAFGTHPETGRLFIQGDLNAGGTGARPAYDGESAHDHLRGLHRAQQPGRGRGVARGPRCGSSRYGLRQDSGGAGTYRGGLGIERVYEFLADAFITFSLERKVTPPWGLRGGADGAVNGVEITSPDGAVRHVRKATQHPIAAGESRAHHDRRRRRLRARRPSAIPRRCAATSREGYVSAEAARRDYGVAAVERRLT